MARPVSLVLTVRDGKGAEAQTLINTVNQDAATLAELLEVARLHQVNTDPVITGQIVRCGLVFDVPLDGTLKVAADANSDVEAGASFVFESAGGFTSKFFLPTFDENKVLPGLADVDVTDSDVAALIEDVLDGYNGGSGLLDVTDSRGDDLTALTAAYEDFHKSRV